jgi:hypothetical protein
MTSAPPPPLYPWQERVIRICAAAVHGQIQFKTVWFIIPPSAGATTVCNRLLEEGLACYMLYDGHIMDDTLYRMPDPIRLPLVVEAGANEIKSMKDIARLARLHGGDANRLVIVISHLTPPEHDPSELLVHTVSDTNTPF